MDRRTLLKAGLAAPAAGLVLPISESFTMSADARPRRGATLARNLKVPWGIDFLPGGNALVSERETGRILLVRKNGSGYRSVGRVPGVFRGPGEGGLLGLALHPNFRRNRWLYAFMTTNVDNRIVRMKYVNGRIGRPRVILKGIPAAQHHNGGGLAFGPGGMLYASTGDAENAGAAQNRRSRAGKILRMTPTGRVPRGNPFGNYTWTFGHRNPEGITFGPHGTLWASEFGEKGSDELNRIVKRHNYGWPRVEGRDGPGGFHDPFVRWDTDACSPSGVAILAGRAWLGALQGECLWSVRLSGPHRGRKRRHFTGDFGRIRSVATAPDRSLWIMTSNNDGRANPGRTDDRIIRIRV